MDLYHNLVYNLSILYILGNNMPLIHSEEENKNSERRWYINIVQNAEMRLFDFLKIKVQLSPALDEANKDSQNLTLEQYQNIQELMADDKNYALSNDDFNKNQQDWVKIQAEQIQEFENLIARSKNSSEKIAGHDEVIAQATAALNNAKLALKEKKDIIKIHDFFQHEREIMERLDAINASLDKNSPYKKQIETIISAAQAMNLHGVILKNATSLDESIQDLEAILNRGDFYDYYALLNKLDTEFNFDGDRIEGKEEFRKIYAQYQAFNLDNPLRNERRDMNNSRINRRIQTAFGELSTVGKTPRQIQEERVHKAHEIRLDEEIKAIDASLARDEKQARDNDTGPEKPNLAYLEIINTRKEDMKRIAVWKNAQLEELGLKKIAVLDRASSLAEAIKRILVNKGVSEDRLPSISLDGEEIQIKYQLEQLIFIAEGVDLTEAQDLATLIVQLKDEMTLYSSIQTNDTKLIEILVETCNKDSEFNYDMQKFKLFLQYCLFVNPNLTPQERNEIETYLSTLTPFLFTYEQRNFSASMADKNKTIEQVLMDFDNLYPQLSATEFIEPMKKMIEFHKQTMLMGLIHGEGRELLKSVLNSITNALTIQNSTAKPLQRSPRLALPAVETVSVLDKILRSTPKAPEVEPQFREYHKTAADRLKIARNVLNKAKQIPRELNKEQDILETIVYAQAEIKGQGKITTNNVVTTRAIVLRNILELKLNSPLASTDPSKVKSEYFYVYLTKMLPHLYKDIFEVGQGGELVIKVGQSPNIVKALGLDKPGENNPNPEAFNPEALETLYNTDGNPLWLVLLSTKPVTTPPDESMTARKKIETYIKLAALFDPGLLKKYTDFKQLLNKTIPFDLDPNSKKSLGEHEKYKGIYNLAQAAASVAGNDAKCKELVSQFFGENSTLGKYIIKKVNGHGKTSEKSEITKFVKEISIVAPSVDDSSRYSSIDTLGSTSTQTASTILSNESTSALSSVADDESVSTDTSDVQATPEMLLAIADQVKLEFKNQSIIEKKLSAMRKILALNVNPPDIPEAIKGCDPAEYTKHYLKNILLVAFNDIFQNDSLEGLVIQHQQTYLVAAALGYPMGGFDLNKQKKDGTAYTFNPAKFNAEALQALYTRDPNPLWLVLKSMKPIGDGFTPEDKIKNFIALAKMSGPNYFGIVPNNPQFGGKKKYETIIKMVKAAYNLAVEYPEQMKLVQDAFGDKKFQETMINKYNNDQEVEKLFANINNAITPPIEKSSPGNQTVTRELTSSDEHSESEPDDFLGESPTEEVEMAPTPPEPASTAETEEVKIPEPAEDSAVESPTEEAIVSSADTAVVLTPPEPENKPVPPAFNLGQATKETVENIIVTPVAEDTTKDEMVPTPPEPASTAEKPRKPTPFDDGRGGSAQKSDAPISTTLINQVDQKERERNTLKKEHTPADDKKPANSVPPDISPESSTGIIFGIIGQAQASLTQPQQPKTNSMPQTGVMDETTTKTPSEETPTSNNNESQKGSRMDSTGICQAFKSNLKQVQKDEDVSKLLKTIRETAEAYKAFSNSHLKSWWFNRHGKAGQERVAAWLNKINAINDVGELQTAVKEYLGDKKNGNTHPHSFRTMLLHALLNPNATPGEATRHELKQTGDNFNEQLDSLKQWSNENTLSPKP